MREFHLFAGIGGGILGGALLGHECVAAVEIDSYCRRVLLERQLDGCLPVFPVHDDVRTFDGRPWRGRVDVICGGFPCQPWSTAGARRGTADPRHLWPEMARIVAEVRPHYVFAENVSIKAFAEPWRDLRQLGYRVPPAVEMSAGDLGAPHRRKRWWLLAEDANTDGRRREGVGQQEPGGQRGARGRQPDRLRARRNRHDAAPAADTNRDELRAQQGRSQPGRACEAEFAINGLPVGVANAGGARLPLPEQGAPRRAAAGRAEGRPAATECGWWSAEPSLGRVAHGIPDRVGQLRALGNAQVPQVAAAAWRYLMARLDPLLS